MVPVPAWGGRLLLLRDMLVYVGRGGAADAHAHHAVQLVWAPGGAVRLTRHEATVAATAALVPAQERHAFQADGALVVLLLVERHGSIGAALDTRARRPADPSLEEDLAAMGVPDVGAPSEALASWATAAVTRLAGSEPPPARPSPAIRRVLAAVEAGAVADLDSAAALAGLSPSRLTHRFTAEVGLPFRRFVLWARLRRAVAAVRDGADLTRAAVEAGFADAAHFSRTFRDTIGLAPSRILPHLEIVGGPRPSGR